MSAAALSPAAMRIVAWLGEVGPRWGLPATACWVHAVLYLTARPMTAPALSEVLGLEAEEAAQALDWLDAHALVQASAQGWQTGLDPWALLMQALETRRAHELDEARTVIAQWRRERDGEGTLVSRQAERLFDLVEDISAIEAGTRGLSSVTTRRLIGLGGRAARLFDRTIGARGGAMSEAGGAAQGTFKVNSLTGLDKADAVAGRVRWDAPRSIWNMAMLAAALILGPLTFSWSALVVFLMTAGITLCAGHSVGFHRRLIHRSFDCPKWVERVLVWFGTVVGIGGPIWTIRLHDSRDWAQRQPDCHWFLRHAKPLPVDGFYYLNFRLELADPPGFDPGPGIADDAFYWFLDRFWMWQQLPIALALYACGGWPWAVWGVCVRVAACSTMHWFISYFAHTRGPQDWTVDGAVIQAYNVPLMAIPTMGESWHSNHHAFPASARHGLYPGQIDLGYRFVQLLEALGLARNIRLPVHLPPRPGITPITQRALSIAAPGQADLARRNQVA